MHRFGYRPAIHAHPFLGELGSPGDFPIVTASEGPTPIYVDPNDHWLVDKTAQWLQEDIERVTGKRPVILHNLPARPITNLIIIGSMDSSDIDPAADAARPPSFKPGRKMGSLYPPTPEQSHPLRRPCPRDHRQRPARHRLRRLRDLPPNRRLPLVLVGRCPGGA